jgi:hypothetical protein
MIELEPLPGFNVTSPADINDSGRVVGSSADPVESGGPSSVATLWSPGPVHVGGLPSVYALSTSGKNSDTVTINNKGEVLYYEYESDPWFGTSFLWANGASIDLSTLGVGEAVDLNDEGLILGYSGDAGAVVYDRGADTSRFLPPLTATANGQKRVLIGLDNAGRVLAAIRTGRDLGTRFSPASFVDHYYYLEIGDTAWKPTPISSSNVQARLSKHGWVLHQVPDAQGNNVACYLDLNDPAAGLSLIPRLTSGGGSYYASALDANAQGRIVGYENGSTPFYYDTSTGELSEIALDPGWTWSRAHTINTGGQVAGIGSAPSGHHRGWLVEAAVSAWKGKLPDLVWQSFIGGVTSDGGGGGSSAANSSRFPPGNRRSTRQRRTS